MSNPQDTYSDPQETFVNASLFELMLIELVPMAYRLEAERTLRDDEWLKNTTPPVTSEARDKQITKSLGIGGIGLSSALLASNATASAAQSSSGATAKDKANTTPVLQDTEIREGVHHRLDTLGYRLGLSLAERFSRDKPRFTDPLDVIKFLCKDIWTLIFKKQIDNLKTNHRGIYVLTDNVFAPLKRCSLEKGRSREEMMAQAQPLLFFPTGVVRGVLSALGIEASVQAETGELPGATFQIRMVGMK